MTSPRLIELDAKALPVDLGKFLIAAQKKALSTKEYFDIAISGGSQASTIADALLSHPEVKWNKWRVWLADERIVPLDHEDCNWFLFKKHVIDKLPADQHPTSFTLSQELLAQIDSVSSEQFANDYQQRLVSTLGETPELDVALLGMGPDGHTCSLFPGHKLLDITDPKILVASLDDSPKPPPRRITLTKPALALVHEIIFIATGASKSEAISRIFKENDHTLPTKQVIDIAKDQVVFLTDPAALGQ
ncbi:hypothetical protein DASB73_030080 [Starmerella bacillaris]|uniref:6-phosphogluconolactonase-like protein n=1 Tax=Starmerella bacillaris TaxID=1247836 RepID=A0AAV5RKH7_STABA|nr:hypothetical protein DASB73_030080 [Starmerella bacillaris]